MTDHSHTDNGEGKDFGVQVMQKLNDKCKEWKEKENIDLAYPTQTLFINNQEGQI